MPHKRQQKPPQKADELLDELESIKSLLDDEQDDIPILEEIIGNEPPLITEKADTPPKDPSILPGQQALFNEKNQSTSHTEKPSSSDNPFLPKHIRERLGSSIEYVHELAQQQRELEQQSLLMPFANDVTRASEQKTTLEKKNTSLAKTIANPDELIDSLVQQYLPIIEDDLRNRLKALLKDS